MGDDFNLKEGVKFVRVVEVTRTETLVAPDDDPEDEAFDDLMQEIGADHPEWDMERVREEAERRFEQRMREPDRDYDDLRERKVERAMRERES